MKIKLEPIGDHVLILRDAAEVKTPGGIYFNKGAMERKLIGRVEAKGPGAMRADGNRTPIEAEVGDRVWFDAYRAERVDPDNEDFLMIHGEQILAKVIEA